MIKKRKLTTILGAALSLFLVFSAVPAHAAETNTLPQQRTTGSITIHKYTQGNAEGTPATGLRDDSQVPQGAKQLPNIKFKITQLNDGTKRVSEITDASQVTEDMKTGVSYTVTTGADEDNKGVVTKSDLPLGTYYVEELYNAAVTKECSPFIVVLPMINPTSNDLIYDVHVYPKNITEDTPTITKSVTTTGNMHDTADIGKNVTWIIEPTIPQGIVSGKEYKVTDQIDSRLDYTDNLSVSFTNKDNKVVTLEKGTDYTVLVPDEKNNRTLTVDFTKAGMSLLDSGKTGANIEIKFTTKINNSAELGVEIPNKAQLTYTNALDQSFTPESGQPEVHTGGLLVEKVDAENTTKKLQGAKFALYKNVEDIKNGTPVMEVASDKDGLALFKGLAYGKYYLVETQAPKDEDGKPYNILDGYKEVTIDAESHKDVHKVVISNKKNVKYSLPLTGGKDTALFTVIGIILMAGAAVIYVSNKKKIAK